MLSIAALIQLCLQARSKRQALLSSRKRHKFNCRSPRLGASKVLGILEGSDRVVLLQVGAINVISQLLGGCPHSSDLDLLTFYLDGACRLLEKSLVPTRRLYTPRSNENTIIHHHNPDADKTMRSTAGTNAQIFPFPENSQYAFRESFATLSCVQLSSSKTTRSGSL